jgi:hypothetical protein
LAAPTLADLRMAVVSETDMGDRFVPLIAPLVAANSPRPASRLWL